MEKYLLVLSVSGVCLYLFMDLYIGLPRDMQVASQYEIVQLHHPLMPPSDSDIASQDEAKVIPMTYPVRIE